MYAEDSLIFLSRYIVNNQLPVPACFKTSRKARVLVACNNS